VVVTVVTPDDERVITESVPPWLVVVRLPVVPAPREAVPVPPETTVVWSPASVHFVSLPSVAFVRYDSAIVSDTSPSTPACDPVTFAASVPPTVLEPVVDQVLSRPVLPAFFVSPLAELLAVPS
jgi:hypothetical protein